MPTYLIYDVDIHDPEPYAEFMRQVKPIVEAYGGPLSGARWGA